MTELSLREDEEIHDLGFLDLKIIQKNHGFKFGVDSILLTDYAKHIKKNSIVMDIGTGTGIIAILLAAKTSLKKIYAVEIQPELADMARRSVILNHLDDKVEIINANIKDICNYVNKNSVDVIVSNPPYKKVDAGLKNTEKIKLISRHEVECNFEDIARESKKLLKDNGTIYVIHRPERIADVICTFRKYKLEPKKIRFVQSRVNEAPKMFLIKAVKGAGEFIKVEKPLVIYENSEYTEELKKIYNL